MAEEKRKVVAVKVKAKPKVELKEELVVEAPVIEEPEIELPKEAAEAPSVFEEPVIEDVPVEEPEVKTGLAKAAEPEKTEASAKTPVWKKWWFWLIAAGLALALIALLLQNRGGNVPGSTANTTAPSTAAGASVTEATAPSTTATTARADGNVDITLPPEFFEGQTKEEIEAAAKADGIPGVVVNADGSVTYTMTQAQRAQLQSQYRGIIDDTIRTFTSGAEDGPKSFRSISYSPNVDRFDIKVDKSAFNRNKRTDSMYVQAFYLLGAYYQAFNGIPAEQVDVAVNIYDESNYELLDSGTYQQFLAEQ